jgi:hypothetical protein
MKNDDTHGINAMKHFAATPDVSSKTENLKTLKFKDALAEDYSGVG